MTGLASFSYDSNGNTGSAANLQTATSTNNRVFFGQGNSSGQGSAIWNQLSVESGPIPEPGTTTLSLVALSGLMLRRRRK